MKVKSKLYAWAIACVPEDGKGFMIDTGSMVANDISVDGRAYMMQKVSMQVGGGFWHPNKYHCIVFSIGKASGGLVLLDGTAGGDNELELTPVDEFMLDFSQEKMDQLQAMMDKDVDQI